jgi:hypothetical protein
MIPFIGFRVEHIGSDGYPVEHRTGYKGNVFQVAWFGRKFFIYVGRVWADDSAGKGGEQP